MTEALQPIIIGAVIGFINILVFGSFVWVLKSIFAGIKELKIENQSIRDDINIIRVNLAKKDGEMVGELKSIWREINTDKHKLSNITDSNQRLWETITEHLGIRRLSDRKKDDS